LLRDKRKFLGKEESMLSRKYSFLIPIVLGVIVLVGLVVFWPAKNANAQCGSQASSCKNCHEVQAQDPVNNDGTGWHQSHAFGDFCYICHGGNNQSMDKDTAHTGMVDPLSDVNAACMSCHPNDLMERSQVYATALGVDIGTGSTPPDAGSGPTGGSSPGGDSSSSSEEPAASSPAGMVVDQTEVIDYNLQYEGKTPINLGNVTLGVMIVIVGLGGGSYVYFNERKLRGVKTRRVAKPTRAAQPLADIEGYPAEVVALLPKLSQLNPLGLHALRRLLENPDEASELLHNLSRLDPELVRRIRTLDRESRLLLMALSGD
jgi:hypothetical protein